MKLSRLRKTYYIVLTLFLTLLVSSFSNISAGGAVLWTGQNLFYITVFLVVASLFYLIAKSKTESFSWVEAFVIGALCLAFFLLDWVGTGPLSLDLDSILYVHSIDLMLSQGFSLTYASNPNFLLSDAYALPMQSMLGAALVLVTNSYYITVAKYLPLLLFLVFLVIYYALVSQRYSKQAALLSLAIVASFPFFMGFSISLNNVDLGTVFLLLTISLVFLRNSGNRFVFTALTFFVIGCFVLTHHLTFVFLVVALAALAIEDQILRRRLNLNLRNETLTVTILVAIAAVGAYYAFVYLGPIQVMLNIFTHQLAVEVSSATPVATWSAPIIAQRAVYLLFISFSVFLSVSLARANLRRFLSRYADFLVLGWVFFVVSVVGAFANFPFNWDRTSIYGWIFFIPATLAMLFERGDLPILRKRTITVAFCVILAAALIFTNVYALPTSLLNHTGANEYQGGAEKVWVKPQEFDSALWTIQYKTPGSHVVGDEVVRRLYLGNSPNFTGNFEPIQSYNESSINSIILLRQENSYQILGTFSPAPGTKGVFSANELVTSLITNESLYRVYDDKEVQILYSPQS
jgi:hypothetical protein